MDIFPGDYTTSCGGPHLKSDRLLERENAALRERMAQLGAAVQRVGSTHSITTRRIEGVL